MYEIRLDILVTNVFRQLTKDLKCYKNKTELNEAEKKDIENIKIFLESELFVSYCDLLNLEFSAIKNNYKDLIN